MVQCSIFTQPEKEVQKWSIYLKYIEEYTLQFSDKNSKLI